MAGIRYRMYIWLLPIWYYRDSYVKSTYTRKATGAIPYPQNVSAHGTSSGWIAADLPGVLFMYGNMDDKVWPYPTNITAMKAAITSQGELSFCSGGSVTLKANEGSFTYQWKKDGVAIANATAISYVATQAGNYTVEVKQGTQTMQPSNTVTVTVQTLATPTISANGPTTFTQGGSVVLASTTGTGFAYQWKKDGVAIASAINSTYTATQAGSYTVEVTLTTCKKSSNILTITVTAPLPTTGGISREYWEM